MSKKHIYKIHKSISIILLISILFVSTCTNDNSILNSEENDLLSRPTNITSGDSGQNDTHWLRFLASMDKIIDRLGGVLGGENADITAQYCLAGFYIGIGSSQHFPTIFQKFNNTDQSELYDFRDNYLLKSEKGEEYTACYYLLSHYGIKNTLAIKNAKEHLTLMNTTIVLSKELQNGINDNKILITKSTYKDIRDLIKIYRSSKNHKDIDILLDYLENDLEDYYNKTIAEIRLDFQ